MSSLFPVAEIELARLGLAACAGAELDVVVGGLGLGYTAVDRARGAAGALAGRRRGPRAGHRLARASACSRMPRRSPTTRAPGWCRATSSRSPRRPAGSAPAARSRVHAVLLDIDHTPAARAAPQPRGVLHRPRGCTPCTATCTPAGSSRCGPTTRRTTTSWPWRAAEFGSVEAHVVSFANPLTGGTSANTVYVAVD